jgi:hypothetical protein
MSRQIAASGRRDPAIVLDGILSPFRLASSPGEAQFPAARGHPARPGSRDQGEPSSAQYLAQRHSWCRQLLDDQ